jgi:zinc transporter
MYVSRENAEQTEMRLRRVAAATNVQVLGGEWWFDEFAFDRFADLRQAAEKFAQAVADAGALVERLELLQHELGAQVSEQTSRTLFVLTAVTVLALPINMVAGLFGMNVGGIPLAEHPHGFLLIAGLLAALTALLLYLVFGRRRD